MKVVHHLAVACHHHHQGAVNVQKHNASNYTAIASNLESYVTPPNVLVSTVIIQRKNQVLMENERK